MQFNPVATIVVVLSIITFQVALSTYLMHRRRQLRAAMQASLKNDPQHQEMMSRIKADVDHIIASHNRPNPHS